MHGIRLSADLLEEAYNRGLFPMADETGSVALYYSDPRSVLELDSLRVSKSLWRVIRRGEYEIRFDRDFEAVIRGCADRESTWIDEDIISAFLELAARGKAHSVEAYRAGELAGGLYGVTLGGAFMGESMFTRRRDASKVCLYHLVERLRLRGFTLLDCQIQNEHLARMGAVEITSEEYMRRLGEALGQRRSFP